MRILVTGASGLVGTALVSALEARGDEVLRLIRSTPKSANEVRWNPEKEIENPSALEGIDAGIHLAGESISEGRWTKEKKERIYTSRVKGTRTLSEALSRLNLSPKTFLCASAIGFYGDRGDEILDEESAPGTGFLTKVCVDWEAAAEPAKERGIRIIHLRFGIVLSDAGGALKKMLPPFKMGVGGKLGSGRQYMSWVTLEDAVRIIIHALDNESLRGPVNVVSTNPVTNLEFTKTLGRVLSRPTFFAVPAFALRLAFGDLADEGLLASTRVIPKRLEQTGYTFRHAQLEDALRSALGKE